MIQEANEPDQYAIDRQATLSNREKLESNRNLLFWYENLYRHQFDALDDFENLRVLEIGSGTSPIKRFHPHVMTSDVLDLDHVDYVFDGHEIDVFSGIEDRSLDVITLTNVLHHLKSPIDFLNRAAVKLKAGGRVVATEPYFSVVSRLMYEKLHHEPVDFGIEEPELQLVEGPLSSANIALPFLIFERRKDWMGRLREKYDLSRESRPYTGISYMATGGISRVIPIPQVLYRFFFGIDRFLAERAQRLLASFFTIELIRLGEEGA